MNKAIVIPLAALALLLAVIAGAMIVGGGKNMNFRTMIPFH